MASLHKDPYPGNWGKLLTETSAEWFRRTSKLLKAIPKNRVYKYPVYDGYAIYYVFSFYPLVVQHIPYLDGYCLPRPHIRGLSLSDLGSEVEIPPNPSIAGEIER